MNAFQKKLAVLPLLRERIGQEKADKVFVELLVLIDELDIEMDGVECPSSVAAIINRFRSISSELAFNVVKEAASSDEVARRVNETPQPEGPAMDSDGVPDEVAVLRRFWIEHHSRAS